QHAGVSRPGMGSVAGDEWRVSYALAEDDSWYSVSADRRDYDCAGATEVRKQTGQGLAPQYCRWQRGHFQRSGIFSGLVRRCFSIQIFPLFRRHGNQ
ncbi:hypothetical protein ACP6ZN_005002, partial [Enterobacter cloacae]